MTVEFGELPDGPLPQTGNRVWRSIVEQLRTRPGQWAKVRTVGSHQSALVTATNLRIGRTEGTVRGEFEAAVRDCDVWARYVGGAS